MNGRGQKKKMGREKFERANAISPRRRMSQVQTDRQTDRQRRRRKNQAIKTKAARMSQKRNIPHFQIAVKVEGEAQQKRE